MKLLSGLVGEIGSVISTLSVSSKEKKQIEADLIAAVCRQEEELSRSRSAIIRAEAGGNWLQRSWRPVVMLVFAAIVLVGTFSIFRYWPILPGSGICWKSVSAVTSLGGVLKKSPVIGREAANEDRSPLFNRLRG